MGLRDRQRRLHAGSIIALSLIVSLCLASSVSAEVAVITHRDTPLGTLSNNALRSIFGMRLRAWPNNEPIRVFVLADQHPVHERFAKEFLSVFPQQLRRAWDRLVYSGTGQAPVEVASEEAMREAVASTPGAIGYLDSDRLTPDVAVIEVQ